MCIVIVHILEIREKRLNISNDAFSKLVFESANATAAICQFLKC